MINIRSVTNGFIVVTDSGDEHIAKTLLEAATICGEYVPGSDDYIAYVPGKNVYTLIEIRKLWRDGQKIAAIKELRSCFAPRFSLRESKELLEELCG